MRFLASLLAVASLALAAPSYQPGADDGSLMARQNPSKWYSKNWGNGKDVTNYEYTSLEGGKFSVTWDEKAGGNFVVGKGLNPGKDWKFNYTGTFEPGKNSNTYLALYGWTYGPTAEYYVIESFGVHHPADHPDSVCFGYFESDGGTYEIWRKYQKNDQGQVLFPQHWAVRTKRRVGGTLTTGNFFKAWNKAGLTMGRQGEMVIGVEGQWGSGKATITAGALPTGTVKESATPTTRTAVPVRTNTCTASIDIS